MQIRTLGERLNKRLSTQQSTRKLPGGLFQNFFAGHGARTGRLTVHFDTVSIQISEKWGKTKMEKTREILFRGFHECQEDKGSL